MVPKDLYDKPDTIRIVVNDPTPPQPDASMRTPPPPSRHTLT